MALIEQTLQRLCQEEDHRHVQQRDWDPSLLELSTSVRTRIPAQVEERCRTARHRTNCGLFAAIRRAWVSTDELLHIWDYHRENSEVMVLPADSAIVSVAICPPRPGIFDENVHWLLVICTRLTVSIVGLHFDSLQANITWQTSSRPQDGQPSPIAPGGSTGSFRPQVDTRSQDRWPGSVSGTGLHSSRPPSSSIAAGLGPSPQQTQSQSRGSASDWLAGSIGKGSMRFIQLEGYSARTDGALFHSVRHTADGHILLICGAPQVSELAYSQTATWFHSKCRLIRHAGGLQARVRDFFSIARNASGRLRLLECASHGYAFTVDDANIIRLFRLKDWVVHRAESVATLEELAAITAVDFAQKAFNLTKRHIASRTITHIFPLMGLDGHLRVQVVTAAHERLLFVCSAVVASGPPPSRPDEFGPGSDIPPSQDWSIVKEFDSEWTSVRKAQEAPKAKSTSDDPPCCRLFHGFWLQQATESRLGHGGTNRSTGLLSTSNLWPQGDTQQASYSTSRATRLACLEEFREPCIYSKGVWVAAATRPGLKASEVGISARLDDSSLYKALMVDSIVLDIVEEADAVNGPARTTLSGRSPRAAPSTDIEGEPSAFRCNRSFAMLLQGCVEVYRLTFKARSFSRPPASASECCLHLAQLSTPQASTGPADAAAGCVWSWSFDDVTLPGFEEQKRYLDHHGGQSSSMPPVQAGRWLNGLLRFLAIVLRPVWELPLVASIRGRHIFDVDWTYSDGYGLAISEEKVRELLTRLRPALRFARRGLLQVTDSSASSSKRAEGGVAVPTSAAARFRLYTQQRVKEDEAVAQARQMLLSVLEVADRAHEVLGLLSVLHNQRNAFRVLQSKVLGAHINDLLNQRFSNIVSNEEGLHPAVQLCSALVVESGLTTPSAVNQPAGASNGRELKSPSGEVCRELEEQCPGIFRRIDLSFVQSRLGSTIPVIGQASACSSTFSLLQPAASTSSSLELLQRYAQCVSLGSCEDYWVALSQSLRQAAMEQPREALEVLVKKLQQLQLQEQQMQVKATPVEGPGIEARVRQLVESLLSSVAFDVRAQTSNDSVLSAQGLIEQLLTRTLSLRFSNEQKSSFGGFAEEAAGSGSVSIVHGIILEFLLVSPQLRPVIQGILDGRGAGAANGVERRVVEAFLASRCLSNPFAGELLWKHRLQQGQPREAAEVLLCLAERRDANCKLPERVQYITQARQVASRALPSSQSLVERISAQLNAAARVQLPLQSEMHLLSNDERVALQWREAAERHRQLLDDKLFCLQELYQLAIQFGLYHLVLIIADLSSSIQELDIGSGTWISLFFPPQDMPYSPTELVVPIPVKSHGLFPLLMVRRCASIFIQDDEPRLLPSPTLAHPEDLKLRVKQLVAELLEALQKGSSLWDVCCVATLLEFSSCLWCKALGEAFVEGPFDRSWLALEVLSQKPFNMSPSGLLKFYAAMLANSASWVKDLRSKIPAYSSRPWPSNEDLCAHLAEATLGILSAWIAQVKCSRDDHKTLEFSTAWTQIEEIIMDLRARLTKFKEKAPSAVASRLISELDRVEADGKLIGAGKATALDSQPPPLLIRDVSLAM